MDNTTRFVDWLGEQHYCINVLYLIPAVTIAMLLLFCYTYYCYLCVCECRRRAELEKSDPTMGQQRSRLSNAEAIRQIHQSRQTECY